MIELGQKFGVPQNLITDFLTDLGCPELLRESGKLFRVLGPTEEKKEILTNVFCSSFDPYTQRQMISEIWCAVILVVGLVDIWV